MGPIKPTPAEICAAFMETILWHLVDPTTEFLNHGLLCSQSGVKLSAKDSVSYLKNIWAICNQYGCPNLSVMVFNKKTQLPGNWYFNVYESIHPGCQYQRAQLVKEELLKVEEYLDWDEVAKKYHLSEVLILRLRARKRKLELLNKVTAQELGEEMNKKKVLS